MGATLRAKGEWVAQMWPRALMRHTAHGAGGIKAGEAAEGKAAEEARAAVALMEDGGLDEELNAAGSSAMVETERDRLIRLVRHAWPGRLPAGRRLPSCNCLGHPTVAVALWAI